MVRILTLLLLLVPLASEAQVVPGQIDREMLDESIVAVLGSHDEITWKVFTLPEGKAAVLKENLRIKQVPDTVHIGIAETAEGVRWIIPDTAPSKSEFFSYVLYTTPELKIVDVDVLEYRENYGYEIDYPFFRKQFRGKNDANEIRFRRGIQNISGATISARSLTWSVHDLLLILKALEVN